jgi:hypothetical protein
MSGDHNVPTGDRKKLSSWTIAKETRVLSELAASVHTLESISQLLDQIGVLAGASEEGNVGVGGVSSKKRAVGLESIATKQKALLDELGQWSKVLHSGGTDEGHNHEAAEQMDEVEVKDK